MSGELRIKYTGPH